MLGRKKADLVISEPDVQAALDHLRGLPFRPAAPAAWDRKRLLDQIGAVTAKVEVGDCLDVAPGVYAIIKPFGVDLLRGEGGSDGRLQVWLCVRAWGTDPERVTSLN
ncbi:MULTISPECIES: hypothetical protein [Delftia]|uniref:Uncharacterized protein n=1 Tax=Delftia lacustris TaxID=558537 RepID=A0A1H3MU47_9BURK|nr:MULTISPECIES: hypothetical protein [Delftia]QPS78371.1 hypothetical protein I6G48_32140 [Delftia acidovorans]QPS84931.1 hypothetical protein I6G47_32815 [Delftia lacustris]SDY80201.1 hypothetical protein SAMN05421547_10845 [Delftia lacustris]